MLTSHSGTYSRGTIEETKSARVANEPKGRDNAKSASSKKGSSVVSGVLAAAAVATVTLEAIYFRLSRATFRTRGGQARRA